MDAPPHPRDYKGVEGECITSSHSQIPTALLPFRKLLPFDDILASLQTIEQQAN